MTAGPLPAQLVAVTLIVQLLLASQGQAEAGKVCSVPVVLLSVKLEPRTSTVYV